MHAFLRIILALDWLIAVAWLLRVLAWRVGLKQVPDLNKSGDRNIEQKRAQEQLPALPRPGVRLSVIVPARNEAANVAATLYSLLASSGVDLEILAVDDRSSDETGAIMDRIRALHEGSGTGATLRVLRITELPAGWLGKTHAMATAARAATGEWLLFTDGDVLFAPEALHRGLGFAVASAADHFVLLPTVLLKTWGERIVISFLQVMAIWGPRPWRIADPRARRDAIGVGAFNMLRREAYEAIGGWEALRMEVVEDLALGSLIKKKGFRQRIAFGRGLVSVRWVEGAFGAVENLSKNLFAVFRFRVGLLLGFLLLFALFTLFPLAALVTGLAACWPGVVLVIAVLLAYRCQAEYQPFSTGDAIWFPVASVLMLYALLRSMLVVLAQGGVTWRGTFYSLRELRQYQRSR
jgi:glycosyltransferase involved in cell wall biosynthesis